MTGDRQGPAGDAGEETRLWRRAKEWLDRHGEVEQAEAAICDLGREDPALRSAVEELLAREDEMGDFLLGPIPLDSLSSDPLEGTRLGPYRLGPCLGQGGSSRVYEAHRDDEAFEKRVAVKVLRWELVDDAARRRFEVERQLLASLEHPGIARLLDGGTASGGLPFVVLELVNGEPITTHCNQRRLGLGARVELLISACESVSYAHRRLVIHRDLKPSNLLVDTEGRPKLLDFGIAKLLSASTTSQTESLHALTPEWASPEQIENGPVGTASDVFSLGVILYELIVGARPWPAHRRLALPGPGSREAPPLEARLRELADDDDPSLERVARQRRTTPGKLRRLARGDLGQIAAKCLRLDPEERYRSVDELIGDLRAYLEGRPIRARRPSGWYRLRRWVRRNRLAAASLTAAAAIVLATSTVATTRIVAERDRALEQTRIAERERSRSEEVTRFLVESLRAGNPVREPRPGLTVRELVDLGRDELSEVGDPDLRAALALHLGEVYGGLGLGRQEIDLLRQALATRRELYADDHLDVAAARLGLARALRQSGHQEEVVNLARRAAATRSQALGPRHPEVAEALEELAISLVHAGEYDEAESTAHQALRTLAAKDTPTASVARARLAGTLAAVAMHQGQHEEAERWASRSLSGLNGVADHFGEELEARQLLGWAQLRLGRLTQAEATLSAHLDACRDRLGNRHELTLSAMGNFAVLLLEQNQFDRAIELLEETLEGNLEVLGPEHETISHNLNALATAYWRKGDLETAQRLFEEAMAAWARLGETDDHPTFAHLSNNLALVLYEKGELPQARLRFEAVLETFARRLDPDHPHVLSVLENLARVAVAEGRLDEAIATLRDVEARAHGQLGVDHPVRRDLTRTLARVLVLAGQDLELAESLLRTLVEGQTEGRDDAMAVASLVDLMSLTGRAEEAVDLGRRAEREESERSPKRPRRLAALRSALLAAETEAGSSSASLAGHREVFRVSGRFRLEAVEARGRLDRYRPEGR